MVWYAEECNHVSWTEHSEAITETTDHAIYY